MREWMSRSLIRSNWKIAPKSAACATPRARASAHCSRRSVASGSCRVRSCIGGRVTRSRSGRRHQTDRVAKIARMDLDVVFIGTAGSAPTARRGLPSTLVRRGGDRLLFDCGEGTQRQLLRSIGLVELEDVFITHFHADHWLGLPGMLKTFSFRGGARRLTVYGPPGLKALFNALRVVIGRNTYPLELVELQPDEEL